LTLGTKYYILEVALLNPNQGGCSMMFDHQPTTELEYWQALEDCDKTIVRLNDGLRRRLIPQDEVKDTQRAIQQASEVSAALLLEIERKFNIFCNKNHPQGTVKPNGMPTLIEWWNKMDALAQERAKTGA